MITHFQYKSIYENKQLPGWTFTFYFKKQKYSGIYHPTGKVEWTSTTPQTVDIPLLERQIHELMVFHVYD